jgi:hypothetical protein
MVALWAIGDFFLAFAVWIWLVSPRMHLQWTEATAAGLFDSGYALTCFPALAELGSQLTTDVRVGETQ